MSLHAEPPPTPQVHLFRSRPQSNVRMRTRFSECTNEQSFSFNRDTESTTARSILPRILRVRCAASQSLRREFTGTDHHDSTAFGDESPNRTSTRDTMGIRFIEVS